MSGVIYTERSEGKGDYVMTRRNYLLGWVLCLVLVLGWSGIVRSQTLGASDIFKSTEIAFFSSLDEQGTSAPGECTDAVWLALTSDKKVGALLLCTPEKSLRLLAQDFRP